MHVPRQHAERDPQGDSPLRRRVETVLLPRGMFLIACSCVEPPLPLRHPLALALSQRGPAVRRPRERRDRHYHFRSQLGALLRLARLLSSPQCGDPFPHRCVVSIPHFVSILVLFLIHHMSSVSRPIRLVRGPPISLPQTFRLARLFPLDPVPRGRAEGILPRPPSLSIQMPPYTA